MVEIRQLSRRTMYENRWMKVHEDTVVFSDGSQGIYGVVDKEDFALIIPVRDDGRFQLVEQYRYPVGGRYWEFPQGSWETKPGTDISLVASGELEEETGYRAKTLTKLGHLFQAYGVTNHGCHVCLATGLVRGQAERDHEGQGMVTKAFRLSEIHDMISRGQIKDAPTIAALGLLAIAGSGSRPFV